MLVRLLYASHASNACPDDVIESIVAKARAFNAAHGITGILCYGDGIFLQALEGSREAVNDLYCHIIRDQRHERVEVLDYEEITERRFAGWTLGRVDLSRLNATVVLKYAELPKLNPYNMTGKAALALLQELMATAAIIGRA
ncbi:MAG: BLUF domain-containing protein [Comamonas sp.]